MPTSLELLFRPRSVAVVGASGSGKSSVVRAGLIPQLRGGEAEGTWEIVTVTPGDRPLHNLAVAVLDMLEPELSEVDRLAEGTASIRSDPLQRPDLDPHSVDAVEDVDFLSLARSDQDGVAVDRHCDSEILEVVHSAP